MSAESSPIDPWCAFVGAALMATAPLELQRHIINTLAGNEKVENLAWLCGGY
jgi:hypothetical protein